MNRTRAWLLTAGLSLIGSSPALAATPETAKTSGSVTDVINAQILAGYAKAGIKKPAEKANDLEFVRRLFIDLIGRIATPEEVLDFERDTAPNKRARLVSRLLYEKKYQPKVNGAVVKIDDKKVLTFDYADEYAKHWANIWTVWLMTRSGHPLYREQMQIWLETQFVDNVNHRDMTVKLLTATGKSNSNGAVNFTIHHLGEPTPEEKRREVGPFDAVPVTSRVTRLFLGIQTNCTQCHDHPFNKEWVQADFWGVNAYFRQTLRDKTPTGGDARRGMDNPVQVELHDDPSYNKEPIIFYERRDGKLMASKPNFLKDLGKAESGDPDSKPVPKEGSKTRREILADYVTKHDNFAKSYVNRIWGHLFGRGLNKEPSVDDFGSHNEIVHPELLDAVAADFVKYNYDPKKLLEAICTSDVYSLSHVANKDCIDPKYEAYFARMPLKALSPEVLFDALMTAAKADSSADADQRKKERDKFMGQLVRNFGDDEGNEMTFNGTVVQALLLMNGKELNTEISRKAATNPVNRIIAKHSKGGVVASDKVIDELFLAALNRHPVAAETAKINVIMNKGAMIAGEAPKPAEKVTAPKTSDTAKEPTKPTDPPKGPKGNLGQGRKGMMAPSAPVPTGPRAVTAAGPNDPTFYQDLFWALLNTNEFMLNH